MIYMYKTTFYSFTDFVYTTTTTHLHVTMIFPDSGDFSTHDILQSMFLTLEILRSIQILQTLERKTHETFI